MAEIRMYHGVDCTTKEEIVRPFTDEENIQADKDAAEFLLRQAAEEAEVTRIAEVKASARAKLVSGEKLTVEEAELIVL